MKMPETGKMGARKRSDYITVISDLGDLGIFDAEFNVGRSRMVAQILLDRGIVAARNAMNTGTTTTTTRSTSYMVDDEEE